MMKRMISKKLNGALEKGDRSYNTFLGEWWYRKSRDGSHRRAYRQIVDRVERVFRTARKKPRLIVDYACGTGGTVAELAHRFPDTWIVGLDGSERMLQLACHDLKRSGYDVDFVGRDAAFGTRGPHVRLVNLALPDYSLPSGRADAALFLFPNMNFSARLVARLQKQVFGDRRQCDVARFLSRLPDLDRPGEKGKPEVICEDILYERALSRNIHQILKRGGLWFKGDYSNCLRTDLSELIQWRMLFSEAAFDVHIDEAEHRDPFELLQNTYYRSRVIRDVYEQTHDKTDRTGGYMISLFRAR